MCSAPYTLILWDGHIILLLVWTTKRRETNRVHVHFFIKNYNYYYCLSHPNIIHIRLPDSQKDRENAYFEILKNARNSGDVCATPLYGKSILSVELSKVWLIISPADDTSLASAMRIVAD